MTEGRHMRNSMSGPLQWATSGLLHQGVAMAAEPLMTPVANLPASWSHQHLAGAAQYPAGRVNGGVVINNGRSGPYQIQSLALVQPHQVANVTTNGIGSTSSNPMGIPGGGHSGGSRQYDSLKQFGSLPQQPAKRSKISTTSKTNLYISGLSDADNDDSVRALVKGVVDPKSCKAMMTDGKCRGSGFIDCVSENDAEKAMQHILDIAANYNRKLGVKFANENEKDDQNVYVRNLPKTNFTNEDLEALFNPYGQVTSVRLLESNGVYTGTGFVRFSTPEQTQAAVDAMNREKKVLRDCDKPVTCKLADKTDPRRKARMSPIGDIGASSGAQNNNSNTSHYHTNQPTSTSSHRGMTHQSTQGHATPHQQSNVGGHTLGLVQAAPTPNGYVPQGSVQGILASHSAGHHPGPHANIPQQRQNGNTTHHSQANHPQTVNVGHMAAVPLQTSHQYPTHPCIIAGLQGMTLNGSGGPTFHPPNGQQVPQNTPVYASQSSVAQQSAPQGYYPVSYHPQSIPPHQPAMTPPNPSGGHALNTANNSVPQPGLMYQGQPGPHFIYTYPGPANAPQHPTQQFNMHYYHAAQQAPPSAQQTFTA